MAASFLLSFLVEFFQGVTGDPRGGAIAIVLVIGLVLCITSRYEDEDDGKDTDQAS